MNKLKVRELLKKYPRLNAIQYCIRHSKDREYCQYVTEKDSLTMSCKTYGEKNKDKNIYYIQYGHKGVGFFAIYRELLHYLYYADRFNMMPVVEFTRDFLYAEKEKINGSNNPFEYFFLQPGTVSLVEKDQSFNVFFGQYAHLLLAENLKQGGGYSLSENYLIEMGRITRSYIHLNPAVEEEIEKHINCIFKGEKVLGVHYRGSDFKIGYYGHPGFVKAEEHLRYTKEAFKKYNFDKVFLATDDVATIEVFLKEFGSKLVFFRDVVRTTGDKSVAFSVNTRANHHYCLGYEVLRDMISLSRCEGLVAGMSQVSICAAITKKSYQNEYIVQHFIDSGINKKGKIYTGV